MDVPRLIGPQLEHFVASRLRNRSLRPLRTKTQANLKSQAGVAKRPPYMSKKNGERYQKHLLEGTRSQKGPICSYSPIYVYDLSVSHIICRTSLLADQHISSSSLCLRFPQRTRGNQHPVTCNMSCVHISTQYIYCQNSIDQTSAVHQSSFFKLNCSPNQWISSITRASPCITITRNPSPANI